MRAPTLSAATRTSIPLSSDLMPRLETAMRTLISSLAFAGPDAWRHEVMRAVCEVFEAEQATFVLPGQPVTTAGYGMDAAAVARVDAFVGATWTGTGTSPDPVLDTFHSLAVRQHLEVWDMDVAAHVLGLRRREFNNPYFHEVLVPQFMDDTHSLFVPSARGSTHLAIHCFRREPEPGEHLPLLRVLLPAFKAGLAALDRLSAHRAALDAVAEPLAVFDIDGVEVHRNPALVHLLATDPEAPRVETAVMRLVWQVRPLGFPLRGERAGLVAPTAEVRTARARYVLRSALLGPSGFGSEGVFMISVHADRTRQNLPSTEMLHARFDLSRREAEVALLVAQGLSNDEIAERLFVSRHTVRHHVENVMAKLEVTGRGREAVAARLFQTA